MGIKAAITLPVIIGIVSVAALACQSATPASPAPSPETPAPPVVAPPPTSEPSTPEPSLPVAPLPPAPTLPPAPDGTVSTTPVPEKLVTGTVTYRERMALTPNAVLEVSLIDVSRADAPSVIIGSLQIEDPGQVPIPFSIVYSPSDIDERMSYAVRATIKENDSLIFTSTSRYSVLTHGNPDNVDLVLERVAQSPDVTPKPQEPDWIQVDAPIESVEVVEADGRYSLKVVSTLPKGSSCSKFDGYDVVVDGTNIKVTLTNLEVDPSGGPMICTADFGIVETDIDIEEELVAGETYRVIVNGKSYSSFTPVDTEGREMALAKSPIENVDLIVMESFPPQYAVTVVSRLPKGSSCSKFNGYDVSRPFSNRIEITVTHYEVTADNVPCTLDLPVVQTNISLGSDFVSGEEYTIVVNDEVTETFTAQ